ncbi:hypothetical protein M408DRAFT_321236 [Serendipita vermifera MAFF 305830]|uniref:Uncharacterized protein n=1 Tax=Serendipita vermifera MAFF 305830 TaxID=933852 RepID=A0A0C2WA03_SERVB|nr:hypothetical protein M408DRAFT_321236 [Serendipita vermifera MAFF 305830]
MFDNIDDDVESERPVGSDSRAENQTVYRTGRDDESGSREIGKGHMTITTRSPDNFRDEESGGNADEDKARPGRRTRRLASSEHLETVLENAQRVVETSRILTRGSVFKAADVKWPRPPSWTGPTCCRPPSLIQFNGRVDLKPNNRSLSEVKILFLRHGELAATFTSTSFFSIGTRYTISSGAKECFEFSGSAH